MKSEHVRCANAIRIELYDLYPKIKFSVRSKTYAGGTSVYVLCPEGVNRDELYTLLSKYEKGRFDMMDDCYRIDNLRDDIPQVRHVLVMGY